VEDAFLIKHLRVIILVIHMFMLILSNVLLTCGIINVGKHVMGAVFYFTVHFERRYTTKYAQLHSEG